MIAFRAHVTGVLSDVWIPPLYALGMVTAETSALEVGRLFDRIGVTALLVAIALSALFAPCVFFGRPGWIVVGAVWLLVALSILLHALGLPLPALARVHPYDKRWFHDNDCADSPW